MVFDFRLADERLFEAMRVDGPRAAGCSRSTARTRSCSTRPSPTRLQRGDVHRATTLPRDHRYVEAVATARALAFARQADAPVHVVHLSSAAALDEVRRAKAAGVRVTAETCPHYLRPDRRALRRPRPGLVRPLRHLAAAARRRPIATRCGRASPTARSTSSPRTTSPTGSTSRRPRPPRGVPFDQISNGAPGIETLLTILYSEGVATRPDHPRADGRPARDDAGAPVRARRPRARSRSAATPTSSCSTRPPAGRSAPPTSTTRATTRRTRGSRSAAPSATSSCAAGRSSATGASSGRRGAGRFVERGADPAPDRPRASTAGRVDG